ncbi:MAG: hypothetical protein D6712_20660 [Chloroflexi bacterium]|nr:MAG: hypothetical protein D6712_20660 [Chloroflexota bacterium]
MSESTIPEEVTPQPHPSRLPRNPFARLGCILLLILWFALLSTPCIIGFLVIQGQGEIRIPQGDAPEQMLRVWFISEASQRGIGISSANAFYADENAVCVETTVSYVLWYGEGEPATYCECYTRNTPTDSWALIQTNTGTCDAQ